jgi:GntR family transcriptional regulator
MIVDHDRDRVGIGGYDKAYGIRDRPPQPQLFRIGVSVYQVQFSNWHRLLPDQIGINYNTDIGNLKGKNKPIQRYIYLHFGAVALKSMRVLGDDVAQHRTKSTLPEGGKARRVYLVLRDEIARGLHLPENLLPAENRLAELHNVSRVTIRRALDVLEADGLIERRVGSGTRVRRQSAKHTMTADITTLIPQLVEMGDATTARLLSFAYASAPEQVAVSMGLEDGARVQTAIRVRSADGRPFSHLTTYVPETIASNYSEGDLATTPLLRLLERSGVQIDGAEETVTATLAAPDVASVLEVSTGSALLSLTRIVRDSGGRAVEYLSALYRPDVFRLQMTLARVGSGPARHWEPVVGGISAQRAAE